MESTIWIAKFLGPIFLAVSVSMIVDPRRLQETTRRFLADSPLILISGVLAMTAGLAIVNSHNVWVWGWPVIVTAFGWALTLGGAVRVATPALVKEVGGAMLDRPTVTRVAGICWGLLGAFLTYKAYL